PAPGFDRSRLAKSPKTVAPYPPIHSTTRRRLDKKKPSHPQAAFAHFPLIRQQDRLVRPLRTIRNDVPCPAYWQRASLPQIAKRGIGILADLTWRVRRQ